MSSPRDLSVFKKVVWPHASREIEKPVKREMSTKFWWSLSCSDSVRVSNLTEFHSFSEDLATVTVTLTVVVIMAPKEAAPDAVDAL